MRYCILVNNVTDDSVNCRKYKFLIWESEKISSDAETFKAK